MGITCKPVGKMKGIMERMKNEQLAEKQAAKMKKKEKKWLELFFKNGKGEEKLIAEPLSREEVIKDINKFLDDHNFKSYYTRVWEENGRLKFDVGSWSEFFYLEGMDFEEWSRKKWHGEIKERR